MLWKRSYSKCFSLNGLPKLPPLQGDHLVPCAKWAASPARGTGHIYPQKACRLQHEKHLPKLLQRLTSLCQWPKTLIPSHSHQPSFSEKCSMCWQSRIKDWPRTSKILLNSGAITVCFGFRYPAKLKEPNQFQNDFVQNFLWTRSQWKEGTWKKCGKQVWHWNIIPSSFSHLTNNITGEIWNLTHWQCQFAVVVVVFKSVPWLLQGCNIRSYFVALSLELNLSCNSKLLLISSAMWYFLI